MYICIYIYIYTCIYIYGLLFKREDHLSNWVIFQYFPANHVEFLATTSKESWPSAIGTPFRLVSSHALTRNVLYQPSPVRVSWSHMALALPHCPSYVVDEQNNPFGVFDTVPLFEELNPFSNLYRSYDMYSSVDIILFRIKHISIMCIYIYI